MLRNNLVQQISKRALSIHEYRSAQLLAQYGIGTPKGKVAFTPQEAGQIARDIPNREIVLKAQALTGGRGKGHFTGPTGLKSGIQMLNNDSNEVIKISEQMLGHNLVTKQSGPKGKFVSGVFVVERLNASKEAYLSIMMDRSTQMSLIIVSKEGGVNIEEVAEKNPDAVKKFYIKNSGQGVDDSLALKIAHELGFDPKLDKEGAKTIQQLFKIFKERDATQIEINPISEVSTKDGERVMCMDAKFGFDDNASFRQEEVFSWRDLSQEDPNEVEAKKYDLNFVKLQGNIGCLVNGAGLAMATMDVIKLYGGDPANFLDCGGGATPETIKKGFELILSNDKVDAIFVNIFGGIVRCDHVAMGLISAAKELDIKIPIIARLQGTNLDEGIRLIKESGVKIYSFDELDPAAKKVVELANEQA
ncbi:succinate--CoA ligase [ADP-forming] subunit beta, mitochondrial [Monosporozyma servazzii]